MQIELNDLLKTKINEKNMQVLLETLREIEKNRQDKTETVDKINEVKSNPKKKRFGFINPFKKKRR